MKFPYVHQIWGGAGQNPAKILCHSHPLAGVGGEVLVAVEGPSPERGEGKIAKFLEFWVNVDIFEHVREIPTKFHLDFDEK